MIFFVDNKRTAVELFANYLEGSYLTFADGYTQPLKEEDVLNILNDNKLNFYEVIDEFERLYKEDEIDYIDDNLPEDIKDMIEEALNAYSSEHNYMDLVEGRE